ncbi:MAG: hypothetical protein HC772_18165 [Leptolyngbyaceae cyanobacterium CRU_2_3]|nr:hypothetical protein [Leptolyngbyaceae cyanobacterium CRU_2_3]
MTTFLAPFLPFLIKLSPQTNNRAAKKFDENDWNKAKTVWEKLGPKIEADEAVKAAVEQVAAKPESEVWKEALQEELEMMLQGDPALAAAIAEILQPGSQRTATPISTEPIRTDDSSIYDDIWETPNPTIGQVQQGSGAYSNRSDGGVPEPLNKIPISAYRADQTASDNATQSKTSTSIFSGNLFVFTLVGIVSLGVIAWFFGVRLSSKGIEINTPANQQQTTPAN